MEVFCFGVPKSHVELTCKHRMVAWIATRHNSLNILPCHSAQANQPAVHERIQSSRMKSRHEFSQSKMAPKH